ncbi:hypothetical protein DVH24_038852 [Malus domestica]|uniref:DRBM domain-containing protein n=1 Tax=Malus domestica TaxID=3750 RepID=A0A498KAS4_MALDO|nr:hypothetical protein DVH24_038852 [Malus domestica]
MALHIPQLQSPNLLPSTNSISHHHSQNTLKSSDLNRNHFPPAPRNPNPLSTRPKIGADPISLRLLPLPKPNRGAPRIVGSDGDAQGGRVKRRGAKKCTRTSCKSWPKGAASTCLPTRPDHAPRFKANVNFNGEIFESPHHCTTLRQAEHSAAEVALNYLSNRGPSHSLAARILDETGVYKNLLQEIAQRVGAPLPQYKTFRSGLGHLPVFTGGNLPRTKNKQRRMQRWQLVAKETASSSFEPEHNDELEQITIARALINYRLKEKMTMANPTAPILFPKKFPFQNRRPTSPQPPPAHTSKILPLICQKQAPRSRFQSNATHDNRVTSSQASSIDSRVMRPQRFPAAGAAPYVPIRQLRTPCHGIAPPVTIRTAVPVFSAPPLPPPHAMPCQTMRIPPLRVAPPVTVRQAAPVFSSSPVKKDDPPTTRKEESPIILKEDSPVVQKEDPPIIPKDSPAVIPPAVQNKSICQVEETVRAAAANDLEESKTIEILEQLKI